MESKQIITILLFACIATGTGGYFWGKSKSRVITEQTRTTSYDTVYVADDTCIMVLKSMTDTLEANYQELLLARTAINNLKRKYTTHEQIIKIDSLNYPGLYTKLKEYESGRNH